MDQGIKTCIIKKKKLMRRLKGDYVKKGSARRFGRGTSSSHKKGGITGK